MRVCSDASRFSLAAGQLGVLRGAAGARIECLHGLLWITEENDGRDVLLQPGGEFTLERDGKTLVQALKPSMVWLVETMPVAAGGGWLQRLGLAFVGYFTQLGVRRAAEGHGRRI